MPYVPTKSESQELRVAVDAAALSEGERIFWLCGLAALVVLDFMCIVGRASLPGVLVATFGFVLLYARLRATHLAKRGNDPKGYFMFGLRSRDQRAFTALMFRQALTGRNALAEREVHDPLNRWKQVSSGPAPDESGDAE